MVYKNTRDDLKLQDLQQWPPRSQIPKLLPKLACKFIPFEGSEEVLSRFWLDRVSYNLLHMRFLDEHSQWKLGEEYQLQFLVKKGIWTKVSVRISYINSRKKKIGMRITACRGLFKHYIGQLLLENNSNWSPKQLYKLQFPVESIKSAINFSTVTTRQEYESVINLREKAYLNAGKISDHQDMSDAFDDRSIIIIAKHGSSVVASLRLIISENDQKFEHEDSLIIPSHLPRKDDMLEITRVCTHPDYRAGDLLEGLFQYSAYISFNQNRNWILGSSTKSLLPIYQRLGFQTTSLVFEHQDFKGGDKHTLFYANKNDILYGRKVSPLIWSIIYKDIYDFAARTGLIKKVLIADRLRVTLYLCFGFFIKKLRKYKLHKSMAQFNL